MYSFVLYLLDVVGTTVVMVIIEVLQMGEMVMDDVILSSSNRHIFRVSCGHPHFSFEWSSTYSTGSH